MAHEGAIEGRGIRRRCASVVVTLALACAAQALAEPVFLEPGSPIYRTLAVAAGHDADCGNRGRIEGNVHANADVKLHPNCRVVGDVTAAGHVHSHHGNVTGTVTSHAAPRSLPAIPAEAQLRALANRIYERDTTLTDAKVDDAVFVRGKLRIRGSLRGTGTLIATGDIELDDHPQATLDPSTRLSLIARGDVELGKGRKLRAVIRAGHDVELEEGAELEGVAIATDEVRVEKATVRFASLVDTTPPALSFTAPPSRVFVSSSGATVQIVLTFADSGSGPDPASFQLTLDGTDARSGCQVTGSGATCQSAPLGVGAHPLAASLRDRAGNQGTASASFELVLDGNPPRIGDLTPSNRTFVASRRPRVAASFEDSGSGVAVASVRLSVDGVDRTGEATVTAAGAVWVPASDLAEGAHEGIVEAADKLGNAATATWSFSVDTTAPAVAFTNPPALLLITEENVAIETSFEEAGSGVDAKTFALLLDGAPVTDCRASGHRAFCLSSPLTNGHHTVQASVSDWAGNRATASSGFDLTVDRDAPVVVIQSPQRGAVVNTPRFEVQGTVSDDGQLASVEVNEVAATLSGGSFSVPIDLTDGTNLVAVVATDSFGRTSMATSEVLLDRVPPTIELAAPTDGRPVNVDIARVEGTASDDHGVQEVTVNGTAASLSDGQFTAVVSLVEGDNDLTIAATDTAGNRAERRLRVNRYSVPDVQITSPEDLSFVASTTVTVSGTVSDGGASVTVDGVPAQVSGTTFTAVGVPLIEGGNTVTATVRDSRGHVATDTIQVVRDLTAPHVEIYYPVASQPLHDAVVTVRGLVNDIVSGTVNASEATVTVNGLAARVANRSFLVEGVPLQPGRNEIRAVAVDESGNRGETTVVVERRSAAEPRVIVVAGSGQTAAIGAPMPEPLMVELRDATGAPVAGRPVVFRVTLGNGSLAGGKRALAITTDAAGRAQTTFTLGTRAGVADHVVEASAVGFAGPAVFVAAATPGPPALVVVDSGGLQVGVAGRELPRPLVAAVVDAGANRLSGTPVTFRVTRGAGHFSDRTQERVVATDSDGRAIVALTLDPEEGTANNVVEARLEGGPVVGFVSSGRAIGDPAQTSISGVVLDNTNQPIAGVTLRVKGTDRVATTDGQGQFKILQAPVGSVKLVADGSTATRPGAWPDLEFDLVTIAGRDTTINMPIFLLPVNLQDGVLVDEVRGGTLTLPDFPGFALEIQPGSVTFPGGGRSGVVSATVVHNDKVPMVPNFGQQPRFIVTIQPAGARFDPPARLTLPNVEGFAPGTVTEMYSFDHDLGHFVSIGPASVSNDGTVIRANPGVGIVKAGWHCGGDPAATGAGHGCGDCAICNGIECTPACSASSASAGLFAKEGCTCTNNPGPCFVDVICPNCQGRRRFLPSQQIWVNGKLGSNEVELKAGDAPVNLELRPLAPAADSAACTDLEVDWRFGDGEEKLGASTSVSHTYHADEEFRVSADFRCRPCPQLRASEVATVEVYSVALKLELVGPISISDDGKYFEEAKVKVTAVNKRTGQVLTNFSDTVVLEETGLPVLYDQNGGDLGNPVEVAGGTGLTKLRSRADAIDNDRPRPARIVVADYPMSGGPLSVEQWVDEGNLDPFPHGGRNYDWFEAMIRDTRARFPMGSGARDVLSKTSDYEIVNQILDAQGDEQKDACGSTKAAPGVSSSRLRATCVGMRADEPRLLKCGAAVTPISTATVLHEARHTYQNYLATVDFGALDTGAGPPNDSDRDLLVEIIPVPPSDIFVDSSVERDGCDAENDSLEEKLKFGGDAVPDRTDAVYWVLEWDALLFTRNNP